MAPSWKLKFQWPDQPDHWVIITTTQVSQHWYRRNRRPHLQVPCQGEILETVRRLDFLIDFLFPLGGGTGNFFWVAAGRLFFCSKNSTKRWWEVISDPEFRREKFPSEGCWSRRWMETVLASWRPCVNPLVWTFGMHLGLGFYCSGGWSWRREQMSPEPRVILMKIVWSTKIFKPYFHQKFRRGKSPQILLSYRQSDTIYFFCSSFFFQTNLSKKSGEEQRNENGIKIIFQVLAERFPRSEKPIPEFLPTVRCWNFTNGLINGISRQCKKTQLHIDRVS